MNVSPKVGRYSYAEYLDLLAIGGFNSVDFMLNDLVFTDSEMYLANTREYSENIRSIARQKGFTIDQTHAPFQFKNWDDAEHFESFIFPQHVRALEMSAIMGAEVMVTHPLHYKTYLGNEEEMFRINMEFFRRLIPYCKEYGVKIGIENMFQRDQRRKCIVGDVCSTSAEMIRYIDTLDSEYMVACLDVGHVGLPARYDEAEDLIRAIGGDRLKALHVHDNDYQNDYHMLPYLGKMNWKEIAAALADVGYTGNFTYEINSSLVNNADESFSPIAIKFISDVGNHIIDMIEERKRIK